MADGDDVMIGTPFVSDILVKVTVVDHIKGPKIDRFKYRPKKRIRVRGGHRQQYTRLLVDFIGRPNEERKVEKNEPASTPVVVEEEPKAEKKAKTSKAAKPKNEAPKTSKKPTATKSSEKKTQKK
jgi:large subunit ribosomal protein L21